MTLQMGARLGHYRIVSLLGRGGMADVYRAEDERLGREVALKAVPPEFARDPERVERFEREVRAAAGLTHPNIVTVYEFGQGEGQHFYTMELMPGGDLKARIREHPDGMPAAEAVSVAAVVARALDYAHKRGFVHRDVKPENILFGEDGTPQLTDFGIARAMSEGTRMTAAGMIIGSPHYMSPEQARGLAVDGRSDLYSLGVVIFEMLTGRLPFDTGDTMAVAYAHVNDPVPKLPSELARWQPVVDRLLAKSPEARYGSARELAAVLAGQGRPQAPATPLTPPPPVTPARHEFDPTMRSKEVSTRLIPTPKPRRGPPAAFVGAALALAAVGIAYIALVGTEDSDGPVSNGGGDSVEVLRESVRPDPPSDPDNPFEFDLSEAVRPETEPVRPKTTSPEPMRSDPTPPRPKRFPVLGGRAVLVVETTPAGAEVLVDGKRVGKTPLKRSDIGSGVRQVTLRHPHYETARERGRRFRDGRVVSIRRALIRGRGALLVTASPRDAWVEVEGRRLADNTPVRLEELPAGPLQVRLGAPEHHPLALEVEIPKDGLARLEPTLERIPYGSLTLEMDPSDASVTMLGTESSYRRGMRLPEGPYRILVRRNGYREARRAIEVSGDLRVRIVLERLRRAGDAREFDGMEFVWVPAGQFRMGSTSREASRDERPVTRVRISRGYWLGKHEVTQSEWQAITGMNPSYFSGCGDCPVESVSWKDVQDYIRKLNARAGGNRYRLPTEAEWEYAARAGTNGDRYESDLDGIAWYSGNRGKRTQAVGQKAPNGFGLHDMLGNVWEWVQDWHSDYPGGSVVDPQGPGSGSDRVSRGGSWIYDAKHCRAPFRFHAKPSFRYSGLGFRLLRPAEDR